MSNIKKLSELKGEVLDESTNYSSSSPEGTRVIANLKTIHDMEQDLEKTEMDREEIKLRDERERNRIELETETERMRIEVDERKSKREARTKRLVAVVALAVGFFGVFEDETRNASKKLAEFVKQGTRF